MDRKELSGLEKMALQQLTYQALPKLSVVFVLKPRFKAVLFIRSETL
jgi:hypothetical protein